MFLIFLSTFIYFCNNITDILIYSQNNSPNYQGRATKSFIFPFGSTIWFSPVLFFYFRWNTRYSLPSFIFRPEIRHYGGKSYFVHVFTEISSWIVSKVRRSKVDRRKYYSFGGGYDDQNYKKNLIIVTMEIEYLSVAHQMTSSKEFTRNENLPMKFNIVANKGVLHLII